MSYAEGINKALTAHGAWKLRLLNAISHGSSEFKVAVVEADNQCDFGRWMYSLPVEVRMSEPCATIRKLHAEFHVEAARVLSLAVSGSTEEALAALEPRSQYANLSGQLALALVKWKQSLKD